MKDMMRRRGKVLLPCALMVILATPILAGSMSWEPVLLDSPEEWAYVYPNNLNESGTIVGFWQPADYSEIHAIVWHDPDGSPEQLDGLEGDSDSWSANVNASGTVCGISGNWPNCRAVTWNNKGEVADRHPDGQAGSDLWSLNDKGEAVGTAWEEWPWTWGWFWPKNGDPEPMDMGEDYISTWPIAINNNSWVAGIGYDVHTPPYYARAIYWDGDGVIHGIHDAIETAAGKSMLWSMAYQMSDKEEVAGFSGDGMGGILAYVYTEEDGAVLLDQDGEAQAFAWQGAGKFLIGATGGASWAPWAWSSALAAVWKRGTENGETTWTLYQLPMIDGYTGMIAVGVNQEGDLAGSAVDEDGSVKGWYADRPQ